MNDDTIGHFLDALASGAPTPGGGAAAALSAATGAALVSMVCNLTIGREKYREHETVMQAALHESTALRAHAIELAVADGEAYAAVRAAYALPRESDADKATRTARIQEALYAATDAPLRTMAVATHVIDLCAAIVHGANTNAVSDVGVGVLSARTALDGAALNVRINLGLIHDAAFKATSQQQMQRYLDTAHPHAEAVLRAVETTLEQ